MKVLTAEFITSAALRPSAEGDRGARDGGPLPPRQRGTHGMYGVPRDGLPQIAFAGRSNVGKSTLINSLCHRRVARTSAAPGKTRLANVYRVALDGAGPGTLVLYFIDLPGYGYARGGANSADELRAIAEAYFVQRRRPAGAEKSGPSARRSKTSDHVLLLVDSRHPGLTSDLAAYEWLTAAGGEPHIVATKIDKLSRSERARNLEAIGNTFATAVLPVSAQSGEGLNELWQLIIRLAKER